MSRRQQQITLVMPACWSPADLCTTPASRSQRLKSDDDDIGVSLTTTVECEEPIDGSPLHVSMRWVTEAFTPTAPHRGG